MKHKKDAIEWGVVAGEREPASTTTEGATTGVGTSVPGGAMVMKDKTGLGLGGWGRTPKDGRGPKTLKSVWREWSEAEEFRTRFEVLSAEEVERREIEKERASRWVTLSRNMSVIPRSAELDDAQTFAQGDIKVPDNTDKAAMKH